MFVRSAILLTVAGLAAAFPKAATTTSHSTTTHTTTQATPTPSYQALTVNNNFETDMNSDPIAATNEIGVYNLLYWTMNLASNGVNGVIVSGLVPHTPNNVAVFSAGTQATDGIPMISANYLTSFIDHFTLSSMYFGCVVSTRESLADVPTACNISATGFNKFNQQVASQTFNFIYFGGTTAQMQQGIFSPAFQNLYYVEFAVSNNQTTGAGIDNVVTTLYENNTSTTG